MNQKPIHKMLESYSEDLEYPTSDGQPMAETDYHRDQMFALIHALQRHFADQDNIYVSGNLLMFYEEGNKRKHISPDVLVTFGIANRKRNHYLVWREGKAPDLVFEITSSSTRSEDLGTKRGLYAFLGVKEYVLFDPREDYLKPRLRLFRLKGENFVPVVGDMTLTTVGLELVVQDNELRLRDPATGDLLATDDEIADAFEAKMRVLEASQEALAAKEGALAETEGALAQTKEALTAQNETLAAQAEALAAKNEALAAKDEALAAQAETLAAQAETLAAKDAALAALEAKLRELENDQR